MELNRVDTFVLNKESNDKLRELVDNDTLCRDLFDSFGDISIAQDYASGQVSYTLNSDSENIHYGAILGLFQQFIKTLDVSDYHQNTIVSCGVLNSAW